MNPDRLDIAMRSLTYTTVDILIAGIRELDNPVMRATCTAEELEQWIDRDIDDAILLLGRPVLHEVWA